MGLGEGDAVFFLGGQPSRFEAVAGKARNVIGKELGLTVEDRFDFCWIVDFPMYEKDPETGTLDFSHNPFSMPQGGLEALDGQDPLDVLGFQYDIVCNGIELSSGAVRNHKPEIMYRAFEVVGHDRAFVDSHFGGMISAFRYGAPPHAGIAPGVDRIVMLLAGAENIREVIMFPMNQRAEDLMMGAPSEVTNEQLRELGLRLCAEGLMPRGPLTFAAALPITTNIVLLQYLQILRTGNLLTALEVQGRRPPGRGVEAGERAVRPARNWAKPIGSEPRFAAIAAKRPSRDDAGGEGIAVPGSSSGAPRYRRSPAAAVAVHADLRLPERGVGIGAGEWRGTGAGAASAGRAKVAAAASNPPSRSPASGPRSRPRGCRAGGRGSRGRWHRAGRRSAGW